MTGIGKELRELDQTATAEASRFGTRTSQMVQETISSLQPPSAGALLPEGDGDNLERLLKLSS